MNVFIKRLLASLLPVSLLCGIKQSCGDQLQLFLVTFLDVCVGAVDRVTTYKCGITPGAS